MAVSSKLREKLEKRQKKLKEGNSLPFLTFPEGTTRIRILSAGKDEDFAIEATRFYLGQNIGGVVSPATFGEPCALLEAYQELKNSGDDDDAQLLKDLKPRKGYFVAVLKMDEKGKAVEEGPKLAIIPKGIYESLIDYMLDEDQGDFTDPKEGYDVKIKRTGKGLTDTEYTLLPCKPTKLDKKYAGVHDLEKMLRDISASYEETEEKLNEFLGTSKDDEDDKPKKKSKKAKGSSDLEDDKPKKKKKKVTSNDEDKPKKKKKKSK